MDTHNTDLIQRLRLWSKDEYGSGAAQLMGKAADAIAQLQVENAKQWALLTAALDRIESLERGTLLRQPLRGDPNAVPPIIVNKPRGMA